jgi:hypothetical protein
VSRGKDSLRGISRAASRRCDFSAQPSCAARRLSSAVPTWLDQMYGNNLSGSPFYQIAQPWMKGYTYNAEFEVHYETAWLDK